MSYLSIMAHRGYSGRFPENSRIAFVEAIKSGADGVECDIQRSSDGHFVVLHDASLERTTSGTGWVSDKTWSELQGLEVAPGEKLLRLEDICEMVPAEIWLNIEIKSPTVRPEDLGRIADIVRMRRSGERTLFSSFNHEMAESLQNLGFKVGLLVGEEHRQLGFGGLIRRVVRLRPFSLNLPFQMVEEFGTWRMGIFCQSMQALNIQIMFWTLNSDRSLRLVASWTDFVITDEVEGLIRTRDAIYGSKPRR